MNEEPARFIRYVALASVILSIYNYIFHFIKTGYIKFNKFKSNWMVNCHSGQADRSMTQQRHYLRHLSITALTRDP
jgi:hypothetical protein